MLCLDRLLKKNVIKIEETFINDGKLENKYKLVSEDFDMITKYMGCAGSKDVLSQKIILDNFTNMIEKIIKNTCENKDVPNLMKGTFIKINSDKIDNFKKELQLLIDRFEDLEDKDEKSVYGFANILGLYSK